MRLLLDTCAALFWWRGDARLSPAAVTALSDPANEVFFHQVSFLEITIKVLRGKLAIGGPASVMVPKAVLAYGIINAKLDDSSIADLEQLPAIHSDPFDRILIAHARCHGLTIVTSDSIIPQYPVPVLW